MADTIVAPAIEKPKARLSGEHHSPPYGISPMRRTAVSGPALGAITRVLSAGKHVVKLGWSKREKKPYEHRAPKCIIDLVSAKLQLVGSGGRRFTTDDLVPLSDPEGRGEVPTYQVYLCLAWMRTEGLVKQHGRQGYSLASGANLRPRVRQSIRETSTPVN